MAMLKLEIFETDQAKPRDVVVTDVSSMEDARLQAYEQGYSAGWEDATAAQSDDQARIRADLARNIQSLGFTFHEARVHVLKAIAPLMQDIALHLLPVLAREALASAVLDKLMPLAEQAAEAPISLVLNPAARPAVTALLEQATGLPLSIVEEPTLGEGQAYLRLGDSETRIDLDRAVAEITAAIHDFFATISKDMPHG